MTTTSAPPTILNVDDTEVARYTKHRTLSHAGFKVVDAVSGGQGLEMVESLRPDLVLLDVRLPDINGIEVCRIIKARWPSTVVLQTSATFTSASDRARGLEGGADAYLIQPIDPEELVASVKALLRLRAAEESMRQLNATLEQRIDERTRDLHEANQRLREQIEQRERAEAALVQAQKMEAVGQLASTMAHDFNNILASLVGYLYIIRRQSPEPRLHDLVDKAVRAADRGKRLTSRVLTFSRQGQGNVTALDVGATLAGMQEWLAQTVGPSTQLVIPPEAAEQHAAMVDLSQFELALLNLVINARDAMPRGGRIEISMRHATLAQADGELTAGDYVVVSVKDSGTGMPPEVVERAFDPFFTTKPAGRGTGLGLAQVINFARQSQGVARIDSTPGQGTCVSLWLAAAPEDASLHGLNALHSPLMLPAAHDLPGAGERILLVDDDEDVRSTVCQMLSDAAYQVTSAASGMEALDLIRQDVPDVLVLDIAMPGISGLTVAQDARQATPGLPIVFISGHAHREAIDAAHLSDAQLLRKPFLSHELNAAIRRCLDGRSAAH